MTSKTKGPAVILERIPVKPVKRDPIWEWSDLAVKLKAGAMGLSADDELIYGCHNREGGDKAGGGF